MYKTLAIIPILPFLLLALVGCGTNTVEPLRRTLSAFHDDKHVEYFETTKPLVAVPVVEYTVTKNAKGENDVVMTVLKKAAETPKAGVLRAEVEMLDDRSFSASIPLKAPTDYPANFFLGDKPIGRAAIVPKKDRVTEEESPVSEE